MFKNFNEEWRNLDLVGSQPQVISGLLVGRIELGVEVGRIELDVEI